MSRKLLSYCRRIFQSRGFRRAARILLWVFLAYMVYCIVLYMKVMRDIGVPLREAFSILMQAKLIPIKYVTPSASIFLGLAAGLIWFFHRRDQKKEAEEEKPAEDSAPVQEEVFTETTHYQSR